MITLVKILGWFLLFICSVLIIFLWAIITGSHPEDTVAVPMLLIFLFIFGFPGLMLLLKARRMTEFEAVSDFVSSMKQLSLQDALQRFKKSPTETERLVLAAAAKRRVDVVYNSKKALFYRRDARFNMRPVHPNCLNCDATIGPQNLTFEEDAQCPFCKCAIEMNPVE
jgi:hypothetical protein